MLVLFMTSGISFAQNLDGSWRAQAVRGGQQFLYEVNLDHSQGRLIGKWSVDASRSSAGCLLGSVGNDVGSFRTCTADGSAGARDMRELCPDYHADQNRFVPKGSKLAWEMWDKQQQSWSLLVLLERSKSVLPLVWDREECGKP